MIVRKSKRFINFLKTTAIGGLLFLLPLIVLGALFGQIAPIVVSVASFLNEYIPVRTATGIAILIIPERGYHAGIVKKKSKTSTATPG